MELRLEFKDEGFEGFVKLRVATTIERYKVMDAIGVDFATLAGETGSEAAAKSFSSLSSMIKLLEISESHYIEVALSKDSKTFKSYEDLNNSIECQAIMVSCAMKALVGLGESEKK